MKQLMQMFDRLRPAAPLVLRVMLGGLFLYFGVDRFDGGIDMVENMFDMWGVPPSVQGTPSIDAGHRARLGNHLVSAEQSLHGTGR